VSFPSPERLRRTLTTASKAFLVIPIYRVSGCTPASTTGSEASAASGGLLAALLELSAGQARAWKGEAEQLATGEP
jgi:hypothetical protein